MQLSSVSRKTQVTRLLSTKPSTPESEQVSELRTQLVESRTQLDSAKEQLEVVRQQAEQYRAISDSMEEELRKSTEATQLFKQQSQQQLVKMTNERNSLKSNLEQAEEKLKVPIDTLIWDCANFLLNLEFECFIVCLFVCLFVFFRNWKKALPVWVKLVLINQKKFWWRLSDSSLSCLQL